MRHFLVTCVGVFFLLLMLAAGLSIFLVYLTGFSYLVAQGHWYVVLGFFVIMAAWFFMRPRSRSDS